MQLLWWGWHFVTASPRDAGASKGLVSLGLLFGWKPLQIMPSFSLVLTERGASRGTSPSCFQKWNWFGSGVGGGGGFPGLFFCPFLVARVFQGTSPVRKSRVSKAVWLQPGIAPFVVAVAGTEEIIRELMGLDGWQEQTWCPLLGCFVATLALLDLSHVLFFALG